MDTLVDTLSDQQYNATNITHPTPAATHLPRRLRLELRARGRLGGGLGRQRHAARQRHGARLLLLLVMHFAGERRRPHAPLSLQQLHTPEAACQ